MTTNYTENFALALPDFRQGPWHDLLNTNIRKIDQIIFGALSSVDTPLWENSTAYVTGQTVTDGDDATTWMCNADHTSATAGTFSADRIAHPTYWVQLLAGFAPRGAWAHGTNYYPYDLAYQASVGVFALCTTRHVSNLSGTILDDSAYWSYIVNFSAISLTTATVVTATPPSGYTGTNVQLMINQLAAAIAAAVTVNNSQASSITAIQTLNTTQDNRLTAVEGVNTTQNTNITNNTNSITTNANAITTLDNAALKKAGNQTITGGFNVTAKNLGNITSFTVAPLQGNYQYGTNVGAFTLTAPASDCGVDILVTNSATAGAISFSGFTVGSTGDALTTTSGHKFLISIRRINSISTYVIKALQ